VRRFFHGFGTAWGRVHARVQLRKLREGAGLTAGRLAKFGSVLSCLGTSDASEGVARLISALAELGDTEEARALKVDYGLELDVLLERTPTPREVRWLGDRRSGYAEVIKRDVKTLARWSDKAVADLRPLLIDDTFRGNLYVVAAVDGDRIAGITIIQEDLEEQPDGIKRRTSTDLENPSEDPSIPALVYAMPRDWRHASLHMSVVIRRERPDRVWARHTPSRPMVVVQSSLVPPTVNRFVPLKAIFCCCPASLGEKRACSTLAVPHSDG